MQSRGLSAFGRHTRRRAIVFVVAAGVIAAACGGGGKKSSTGGNNAAVQETTTTSTTAATTETSSGASTSTTAAAASATNVTTARTPTTARKTTPTTTRKSAAITTPLQKPLQSLQSGIANVGPTSTAPNAAAQPGGQLVWLKSGDISGLDPIELINSGPADAPLAMAVYDLLVYSDGGAVKGNTIDSLTSSDAVVWTLKLHPNIKFTDGTPYDAAAVKFNFDRIADPANAAVRASAAQTMAQKDVIDASTLKITLKAKNALFPSLLTSMPYVGSPKAIQAEGSKFSSNPVGAGPYILKQWNRDSQAIFDRNPSYWNAPLPYIDRIIMKPITDESQRMNTFCTGAGDLVAITGVGNADQMTKQNCGKINPLVLNGGTNLHMNTRIKPFNDIRLRQAVAMAIDMNDYSKVLDNGLIPPTHSVFRPDSPFYDPNILELPYDPVKAQQLFDAVAKDNGGTISWTLTTFQTAIYSTPSDYIQGKLNAYNHVHVDLIKEVAATHITNTNNSNFTMSMYGNNFDDPEPSWTSIYTCKGTPNYTGYCDPNFDALVSDNQTTLDPNRRIQDIKDMQKLIYAAIPSWYFENRYTWMFTVNNLQDFHFVNDALPLLDRFWLKTR